MWRNFLNKVEKNVDKIIRDRESKTKYFMEQKKERKKEWKMSMTNFTKFHLIEKNKKKQKHVRQVQIVYT